MSRKVKLPYNAVNWLLEPLSAGGWISWEAVFNNSNPVEVEIGPGKGEFLEYIALLKPSTNFLGIEKNGKYFSKALARISNNRLSNVKLIKGEALSIFQNNIPPATISAIHIYFPDPWWKRRHWKRRLLNPQFIQLLWKSLNNDSGGLFLATDVKEYFDLIVLISSNYFKLEERKVEMNLPWKSKFSSQALLNKRPIYFAKFTPNKIVDFAKEESNQSVFVYFNRSQYFTPDKAGKISNI